MSSEITYMSAAAAGLLSFLSPCVVPLLPPYISFLTGLTLEEITNRDLKQARLHVFVASCLFVLGFTTVFVLLGMTSSLLGQFLRAYLSLFILLAGILIIGMGLHFLGIFRLHLLYRQAQWHVEPPPTLWGAFGIGVAFALGWSPCIGPILASILALSSAQETAYEGALLLMTYSLSLGVPFILAALLLEIFFSFMQKFKYLFPILEKISGLLLIGIGGVTLWHTI